MKLNRLPLKKWCNWRRSYQKSYAKVWENRKCGRKIIKFNCDLFHLKLMPTLEGLIHNNFIYFSLASFWFLAIQEKPKKLLLNIPHYTILFIMSIKIDDVRNGERHSSFVSNHAIIHWLFFHLSLSMSMTDGLCECDWNGNIHLRANDAC